MRIAFLGNFLVDYTSETHHAKSLGELGHQVTCLQETAVHPDAIRTAAADADLFVWVHTHGWHTPEIETALADAINRNIPVITYHLDLWKGLHREQDMATDPYWKVLTDFFTCDQLMADYLTEHTSVRGHYLPPGVFGQECYMAEPDAPFDVAFVGSYQYHPEWPYRGQLVDWLRETYGDRFRHYGGGGLPTVRGAALNRVYANARVSVGDTLCLGFDYPWYWSDRLFETAGRGGFQIFPRIEGITDCLTEDKEVVLYSYGDFDELRHKIDYYLTHDSEREAIRRAGFDRTCAEHTYAHRWKHILETLNLT
jgi:glycosyltransferase involved in cell wall biosynthesis